MEKLQRKQEQEDKGKHFKATQSKATHRGINQATKPQASQTDQSCNIYICIYHMFVRMFICISFCVYSHIMSKPLLHTWISEHHLNVCTKTFNKVCKSLPVDVCVWVMCVWTTPKLHCEKCTKFIYCNLYLLNIYHIVL